MRIFSNYAYAGKICLAKTVELQDRKAHGKSEAAEAYARLYMKIENEAKWPWNINSEHAVSSLKSKIISFLLI